MSDESDDKTEAPTPHRLEKAREEGQIPRSRELTSLLILLVGVSTLPCSMERVRTKRSSGNDLPGHFRSGKDI